MHKLIGKTLGIAGVFIIITLSTGAIMPKLSCSLTGTWVLDSLQSDLAKVEDACPKSIKIKMIGKTISIGKIATNGEVKIEKFTTDGKSVNIPVPIKGYTKISTTILKEDLLEVSSSYTVDKDDKGNPAYSYQRKETYTVSADGKILTYLDNYRGSKGSQSFKGVYNKDK